MESNSSSKLSRFLTCFRYLVDFNFESKRISPALLPCNESSNAKDKSMMIPQSASFVASLPVKRVSVSKPVLDNITSDPRLFAGTDTSILVVSLPKSSFGTDDSRLSDSSLISYLEPLETNVRVLLS